jgi:hypothetical protein
VKRPGRDVPEREEDVIGRFSAEPLTRTRLPLGLQVRSTSGGQHRRRVLGICVDENGYRSLVPTKATLVPSLAFVVTTTKDNQHGHAYGGAVGSAWSQASCDWLGSDKWWFTERDASRRVAE